MESFEEDGTTRAELQEQIQELELQEAFHNTHHLESQFDKATLRQLVEPLIYDSELVRSYGGSNLRNKMRMSNTCCLCGESSAGQFIWLSSLLRNLETSWKDRVGVTEQQQADYQILMARMQAIIGAAEQAPERLSLSVCRACSKYTRLHHKWTDPRDRRTARSTVNRCPRVSEPVLTMRTAPHALDEWRWESRGQRNIAGQKHPRIYYTCKVPGCPARKTVDQNPDGSGQVVIRYYGGEHTHEPPMQEPGAIVLAKRRKRDIDDTEGESETHSSRPVGGFPGGMDVLSPMLPGRLLRKRSPGSEEAIQVNAPFDTYQLDMCALDALNSGHTTVNLMDVASGHLALGNGTGQNGTSHFPLLQSQAKPDTPTHPMSAAPEPSSQPFMAKVLHLAKQQSTAATQALTLQEMDVPPALSEPEAPYLGKAREWTQSMMNAVPGDANARQPPPSRTMAHTPGLAPSSPRSVVVADRTEPAAGGGGGGVAYAPTPAFQMDPPPPSVPSPNTEMHWVTIPPTMSTQPVTQKEQAQAGAGHRVWQNKPSAPPAAPPSANPMWSTQILHADGQWAQAPDAPPPDAPPVARWQTEEAQAATANGATQASGPAAAPPPNSPALTTYQTGDQVWMLQSSQAPPAAPASPQAVAAPGPAAPTAPTEHRTVQTTAVIEWQNSETIVLNGKQWRVVKEMPANEPPAPPPPPPAPASSWQLPTATQVQGPPWQQALASHALHMPAAGMGSGGPQYQIVVLPSPAPAPVPAPMQQWIAAAPPAPGAQPAIIWMMPSQ